MADYVCRLVADDLGDRPSSADADNRSNTRAKDILSAGERLTTTDHVLVETWTLIRWRIHREAAEAFWRGIRSGAATLEPIGPADLQAAWTNGSAKRRPRLRGAYGVTLRETETTQCPVSSRRAICRIQDRLDILEHLELPHQPPPISPARGRLNQLPR